ncbi:TatD family hydrolase [Kineothrix sp. MB12-C1]|uniref:TatD family hydrolase n=1 Tax=Kineothrix sp. MB12-C1 TaxID=3070215 RepID=UPI0027D25E7C|nr:TatD family hydrolase [Kineothrix sp. MB12-C1]WMC94359.1 TatD family hydrolase [Kineothrix sp. MB12-C1]
MIFESHAHYDDDAFNEDRGELLSSLQEKGIEYVINIGASIATTKNTITLTEKYPFIYGAVGVHPSDTEELDEEKFTWMKEQCSLPKIVAVGEIGLDYYWDEPDRKIQKKWFTRQLQMAREVKLPVVIHSRDAAKDTVDMMRAERAEEIGGVVHCYSYTKETAREFLTMDFSFGIGGVITFNNAKKLKEAVEYIPIEKILLETDSPYLAPMPYRGKRNSSLNLPLIAAQIAEIKGMSQEEVVAITTENAKRLFCI